MNPETAEVLSQLGLNADNLKACKRPVITEEGLVKKVLICTAPTVNKSGVTGHTMAPPLGLMSLIGYARQFFPKIEFILKDFEAGLATDEEIEAFLQEVKPQVVGIQSRSPVMPMATALAYTVKKLLPETRVVLGGHHPSTNPHGTFPDIFDCTVISEGENALCDLVQLANSGKPWPKTYRGVFLKELDYAAAWDLADPSIYKSPSSAFTVSPMGSTLWSRGCSFDCVFCSGPGVWQEQSPRVKYRPVHRIVDELEYISSTLGVSRLYIHDDTLNTNIKTLGAICDEIIRRKVKITWFGCGLRADKKITPRWLFEKMKKAGCWGVNFGVESGDPYVLEKISKRVSLDDVERALRLAKDAGLRTATGFTIGHAWLGDDGKLTGETTENLENTVKYIKRLADLNLIYSVWVAIVTPFPGSPLWDYVKDSRVEMYDEFGEDFLKKGRVRAMFKHPVLSDEDIEKYYSKAFHIIGFNWKHGLSRLFAVREWSDLRGIIWGGAFVLQRTVPLFIKNFLKPSKT